MSGSSRRTTGCYKVSDRSADTSRPTEVPDTSFEGVVEYERLLGGVRTARADSCPTLPCPASPPVTARPIIVAMAVEVDEPFEELTKGKDTKVA